MELGLSSLDVVEMEKRRNSVGMLTPSPSLSGGSSDEADLDTEVDYDQAYRMLAVTLGFENSRDATSLDVAAGGGNPIQGQGPGVVDPHQGQQDQLSPQGPAQFATLPGPGVPSMPGAHGFANPIGSGSVTMPTPSATNTQPQLSTMTSSQQPATSPLPQQQQMPAFMASMRNQGSIFPTPNLMMLQNLFGGNNGRDSRSRTGNYNNPLVTFMRTLFQQQQQQQAQQMQSGHHGNSSGSSMANIFNNIPEQILMENMFNFNQNSVSNNQQQQHHPSNRKSLNHQQKRQRTSGQTQRNTAGYYSLQNQRNPSSAPWGFYLNRDGSDVMFPPFTPPPRLGCPGNG